MNELDMRALYYITLAQSLKAGDDIENYDNAIKANENMLNQNFRIIADKLDEITALIAAMNN